MLGTVAAGGVGPAPQESAPDASRWLNLQHLLSPHRHLNASPSATILGHTCCSLSVFSGVAKSSPVIPGYMQSYGRMSSQILLLVIMWLDKRSWYDLVSTKEYSVTCVAACLVRFGKSVALWLLMSNRLLTVYHAQSESNAMDYGPWCEEFCTLSINRSDSVNVPVVIVRT